jgi:hypothetical protein
MTKWVLFAVLTLSFAITMMGCAPTYVGGGGGVSSHQAPESPDRRTSELRDYISIIRQYDLAPPRNPFITFQNSTNQSIKLQLSGGTAYTLAPNSASTVEFAPGSFGYEAQIAGFPPLAGQATFETNTDYSWVFSYTRP